MVLIEWLLALLIFLIPSNLFLKLWPENAYVNGVLVDYLIPKIHLSEIALWALIIAMLLGAKKAGQLGTIFQCSLRKNWVLVVLMSGFFVRQFFVPYPMAAFESLSNWAGIGIIVWIFNSSWGAKLLKKFHKGTIVWTSLMTTVIFQSISGIYQFWAQKSLAGYLLLGEGNLQAIGKISKTVINGREVILPMGTTSHPNVLAGFIAVSLIMLLAKFITSEKSWKINWYPRILITFILGVWCLMLTTSISGLLAFLAGFLAVVFRNKFKKISNKKLVAAFLFGMILVPIFINSFAQNFDQSWWRRAYLNEAGLREFFSNPVFGIGLQNSTALIENFTTEREVVRFVQPPHHVGILLLAEIGIWGVFLICGLVYFCCKRRHTKFNFWKLLLLLPIIVLDHYLFTLYTGNLIILLLFIALYI